MTRMLVTGFGPFDGVAVNLSETVIHALSRRPPPPPQERVTAVLPTAYDEAAE